MSQGKENLPEEPSYQGKLYLPELLTFNLVTEVFGVSKSTIYQWIEKYRMPHVKLGRITYFLESSLQKWLIFRESHGETVSKPSETVPENA